MTLVIKLIIAWKLFYLSNIKSYTLLSIVAQALLKLSDQKEHKGLTRNPSNSGFSELTKVKLLHCDGIAL